MTPAQLEVLCYVHEYTQKKKMSPTIAEISEFRGCNSYEAVCATVKAGLLKRTPKAHRGLSVTKQGLSLLQGPE